RVAEARRAPFGGAVADLETARLVVVEARGAVGFAVAVPRRHPRLEIELLDLRHAEVAAANVENAVRKLERPKQHFRVLEDRRVPTFAFFLVGAAEDHLLHFLELVNAVDPVRVLAVGPRLAPETGAPRHVFSRQRGLLQD